MTEQTRTVAAICIPDADGRWLLVRRSSQSHGGDLWSFPAGKVEPGERLTDALVREAQEEMGLAVKPVRRFAVLDQPQWGVRIHAWKCLPVGGMNITLAPRELSDANWYTPEQMATEPGMLASTVLLAPWLPTRGERVPRLHGACDGETPCMVGDHDYDYCDCPAGKDLKDQETDGRLVTGHLTPQQIQSAVQAGVSLPVVRHTLTTGLDLAAVTALATQVRGGAQPDRILAALREFGTCPDPEAYDRWLTARLSRESSRAKRSSVGFGR